MKVQAIGLMLALLAGGPALAGTGQIFQGEPVAIGKGMARIVVAVGAGGAPTAVAIVMSEAALDGLPVQLPDGQPEVEFVLPMPEEAPESGYRHATINWNPHGHGPSGIYDKPHFDFHFYLIGGTARQGVTFQGADAGAAKAVAA